MKSLTLRDILSDCFDRAPDTVMGATIKPLQAAGMIATGTRGRSGGVDLRASDAVNGLLGVAVDFGRGADIAKELRRIRRLPLAAPGLVPQLADNSLESAVRAAFRFTHGLSLTPLMNFGQALESVLKDLQTGAFDRWALDHASIVVEIYNDGRNALIAFDQPSDGTGAAFSFAGKGSKPSNGVEKIVRLNTIIFRTLANALGPLTEDHT